MKIAVIFTIIAFFLIGCKTENTFLKGNESNQKEQNNASLGLDLLEQETDPLVLEKLEKYQDLKFGFFAHWGIYSQWGGVASWPLIKNFKGTRTYDIAFAKCNKDFDKYFKFYYNSNKTFNPTKFNPLEWADAAKSAGMKYFVFVTKHHDGFCMFDSKQTDFTITGTDSPYRSNSNSNITKVLFDAFREKGISVGAYFSKPDWSNSDYWASEFPVSDHSVNYDPRKYPEKWKKFKTFTYNQIEELVTDYGPIDMLWLDGAQVLPVANQDIDMDRIARMARKNQPGLIIVDRLAGGKFENYLSPEGHHNLPKKPLHKPWELCMSLGKGWSHRNNDVFKPSKEIIHILIDVVSKGGNLLLDVGPPASGEIPAAALKSMKEIGMWLEINGEGIYNTRSFKYFQENDQIYYTQSKNGETIYALCYEWPETSLKLTKVRPRKDSKIHLLGSDKELSWNHANGVLTIDLPEELKGKIKHSSKQAFVFRIEGSALESVNNIDVKYANINDSGSYFSDNNCTLMLSCPTPGAQIHFTLDGTEPNESSAIYKQAIRIDTTTIVKAIAKKNGLADSPIFQKKITKIIKPEQITLSSKLNSSQMEVNGDRLMDLKRGSLSETNRDWIGFEQEDFIASLDLGKVKRIRKISLGFLKNVYESIFVPDSVNYYISKDGTNYSMIGSVKYKISPFEMKVYVKDYVLDSINNSARFIKIEAKNRGICPHPHFNSAGKAWLYTDEILVE
tara:strand:+ start:5877 stop:8072 length:2196 start_codon:yes stop_codon:yes gene_type:complete